MSELATRSWLGVGLGLRRPHLAALRERLSNHLDDPGLDDPGLDDPGLDDPGLDDPGLDDPGPNELEVLELTPSHWLARPELVEPLAERHPIVLHDVFASLATAGPLDRAHLAQVAAFARRVGAVDYSEHLAMTRSPRGLDLGHLIPIPRTRAQLEVLVEHVREAQDLLELPVAIEPPATTLALPFAELDEGEFLTELVERSGCGLHLDLENLRVDALNHLPEHPDDRPGDRVAAELTAALTRAGVPSPLDRVIGRRLATYPLGAVARIHLAGGHVDRDGWVVDSHAAPIPPETHAILTGLRAYLRPRAIIVERDANLPGLEAVLAEVARTRQIWACAANEAHFEP